MPASALNLTLAAEILGYVEFANDIAPARQTIGAAPQIRLALGTLANQADLFFADTRTLAASGTENLDLNGSLTDVSGATFNALDVLGLLVIADAANTNDVLVGGAGTNAAASFFGANTDYVRVKPGGFMFLAAQKDPAYAVTATTADLLKIANSAAGSSVTYTVVIIGRSA